jgi:hypothetical protein
MYHRIFNCRPLEHVGLHVIAQGNQLLIIARCENCGAQSRTTLVPGHAYCSQILNEAIN